jgi:hypothetical protein
MYTGLFVFVIAVKTTSLKMPTKGDQNIYNYYNQ